jgi:CDP-glucose 4,6-dehydratase
MSGYLWLGARLATDGRRFDGPWNFGPPDEAPVSVASLVEQILERWPDARTRMVVERDESGREAPTLRLDSSKAGRELGWGRAWSIAEALDATVVGYRGFVGGVGDMYRLCVEQIATFSEAARARGLAWTNRAPRSP